MVNYWCGLVLLCLLALVSCQDEPPRFTQGLKSLVISEDEKVGFHVEELSKYVKYTGTGNILYGIDSSGGLYLNVQKENGTVTLKRQLDRENLATHPTYEVSVSIVLNGEVVEDRMKILIIVGDTNDNIPVIQGNSNVAVKEDLRIGSTVTWLTAVDPDLNEKGNVNITLANPSDIFQITSFIYNNTAKITLLKTLDYETTKVYTLRLTATDLGIPSLSSTSLLTVNVEDISDTIPYFVVTPYSKYVPESVEKGDSLVRVEAHDGDLGINDEIFYNIKLDSTDDSSLFSIDVKSGVVSLKTGHLDRERKLTYTFAVRASEKLDPASFNDVTVYIFPEDVNDNKPTFAESNYVIRVDENVPKGTRIFSNFLVEDADVTAKNKRFIFSLTPGYDLFTIDATNGDLSTSTELDFEVNDIYNFKVFATELQTIERYSGNATVTVKVQNVNDNSPVFTQNSYTFTVMENITATDIIGYVKATDADYGLYGVVKYTIENASIFSVNSSTGAVFATSGADLDFEKQAEYQIEVIATDTSSFTSGRAKATVTIRLTDVNDNSPVFDNLPHVVKLTENEGEKVLFYVTASDKDLNRNGEFFYTIFNSSYPAAQVTINATTGLVRLLSPLDYETVHSFTIAITATDQGSPPLSRTEYLTLEVQDVNDNAPTFNQSVYIGEVVETLNTGVSVMKVFGSDKDSGVNGEIMYQIKEGNEERVFAIANTGIITTLKPVDRETRDSYNLTVTATDKGSIPMKSSCKVQIQILDANDERPVFTKTDYTANVNETAEIGSHVITISASDNDLDGNGKLQYSIISGNENRDFLINKTTGVVTVNQKIDRETKVRYTMIVQVQDSGHDPLARTTTLIINIIDNNDNPPIFRIDEPYYTFSIYENFPKNSLGYVIAVDEDGTLPSYYITAGNEDGAFFLNETIGSLQTNKPLDREQKDFYNLTITAVDNGIPPMRTSIQCHVTVLDLNDNQPQFNQTNYKVSIPENEAVGSFILQVSAFDPDKGLNGKVEMSLSSRGQSQDWSDIFKISKDGRLVLNKLLDHETVKEHTLTIDALDSGPSTLSSSTTLTVTVLDVNDNAPRFTGSTHIANVYEAQPSPTTFFQVISTDDDSGVNAKISYSIVNATSFTNPLQTIDLFSINSTTGFMSTKEPLNRDANNRYKVIVRLEDHGTPSLSSLVEIEVIVLDWNTHAPVFSNLPTVFNMSALTSENIQVFQVQAADADEGENARMNFKIISGGEGHFRIESSSGIIWTTSSPFERRVHNQYNFLIQAGVAPYIANSTLTIKIVDPNSVNPTFEPDPAYFPQEYIVTVKEIYPLNQPIIDLNATDHANHTTLKYHVTQDGMGYFAIDENTGLVRLRKTLDRESEGLKLNADKLGVITFSVVVSDNTDSARSSTVQVTVLIADANDNVPVFEQQTYMASVEESSSLGHLVTVVKANDKDLGFSGIVEYHITAGNEKGSFSIPDITNGRVTVAGTLNKEEISEYSLTIQAKDRGEKFGESSLASYTTLQIYIGDVNDNSPIFEETAYAATVQENAPKGSILLNVTATDKDTGANGQVWYEIVSGNFEDVFHIDKNSSGEVKVDGRLDREQHKSYTLTVQASDYGFPIQRKTTVQVFITVSDINDNVPRFNNQTYQGAVRENEAQGTQVMVVPEIGASDPDSNNKLTYHANKYNPLFTIDSQTGIVATSSILDRESTDQYMFEIRVSDQDGLFTTTNISIMVQDTNDNVPLFNKTIDTVNASESLSVGSVVYTASANDLDVNKNSNVSYYLFEMSRVFEMVPNTGQLKLISNLDRENKDAYKLLIIARDHGTPTLSSNMTLRINVIDVIDSRPYFEPTSIKVDVSENITINSIIYKVNAKDLDLKDALSYIKTNSSEPGFFSINNSSGEIMLTKALDRETLSFHSLNVQAVDSSGLSTSLDGLKLFINVKDANDNSPVFMHSNCVIDVTNNVPDGSIIYIVSATDKDLGLNGQVSYHLSANITNVLTINSSTGVVRKTGNLKQYALQQIQFSVTAKDKGSPQQMKSSKCSLNIIQILVDSPKFEQSAYTVSISEKSKIRTLVGNYPATMIGGVQPSYSLIGGNELFAVNETGSIYTVSELDTETLSLMVFTLVANNKGTLGIAIFTVKITDENDNFPKFTEPFYEFEVSENANHSIPVGQVSATDADSGYNSFIQYGLQPSQFSRFFSIDDLTGTITPDASLDRETKDSYEFTVRASDHGVPSLSTFVQVRIKVTDINDHHPVFDQKIYSVNVPENVKIGTLLLELKATDNDVGLNSEVVYSIISGNNESYFVCGELSGKIFIYKSLDVERQQNFTLTVKATDRGLPSLSSVAMVTITLIDINDEYPVFIVPPKFSAYENMTVGSVIGQLNAVDNDISPEFSSVYYGITDNNEQVVLINQQTGEMTLHKKLDYEVKTSYIFTVIAYNQMNGNRTLTTEQEVKVNVLNVNDNAPTFPPSCCSINVSESHSTGDVLLRLSATDADRDQNSNISYLLQYGNINEYFYLSSTGDLTLNKKLNREEIQLFRLRIKATDNGTPPLQNYTDIYITVKDVNDEAPIFEKVLFQAVPESAPIGTSIGQIVAKDRDLGLNGVVTYTIISGNDENDLVLNSTTGILYNVKMLDYESKPTYQIEVEAKDHGMPSLSSSHMFTVPVLNVNDNEPSFDKLIVSAQVMENAPIGITVTVIQANDADNDQIFYLIVAGNEDGLFHMDSSTGTLTTTKSLDRETKSKYILSIEATNVIQTANTQNRRRRSLGPTIQKVEILVGDQNDNPPQFVEKTFSGSISEESVKGTSVLQVQATDSDTGNGSMLYYELENQDKFSIDQITGWIYSQETFKGESGKTYEFNIIVKDNQGKGNYSQDVAVAKIFVITDAQSILLLIQSPTDAVRTNKQEIVRIIENCTNYVIRIDSIYLQQENDPSSSVFSFHAVEKTTNVIVHRDVVIRKIEAEYSCMRGVFDRLNITEYTGKRIPLNASKVDDDTRIIIAVVAVLIVFILCLIIFFAWRARRRHRKITLDEIDAQKERDSRQTIHIHPFSAAFPYISDEATIIQSKEAFVIPEDMPRTNSESYMTSFHGTAEDDDEGFESNSSVDSYNPNKVSLPPSPKEAIMQSKNMNLPKKPPRVHKYPSTKTPRITKRPSSPKDPESKLTLLDVLAKQESDAHSEDGKGAYANKGLEYDDDAGSHTTEMTESIAAPEDYDHDNDIIRIPVYSTINFEDLTDTKL